MYCLMCQKKLSQGSFRDIFMSDDMLCETCRTSWVKKKIHFQFEGIPLDSDYVYNDAFSSALIQMKECYDEALKDIFLYEVKKKLKRRYQGYTLCMAPSTHQKYEERGFSHLYEIFSCLGLPIIEPFEKTIQMTQKSASYSERKLMSHEIRCIKELPKKIVLCDDTITSGATLSGCLHAIDKQAHDIRIYCVSCNQSWLR